MSSIFSQHTSRNLLPCCPCIQHQQAFGVVRWPRGRLQCRAANKEDKGKGGGINWDAEWKKAKARLPEVPVENVSKRNASPRLRNQRDRIREQENAVLNIFSQESFFKAGGALVVFLVLFFVFVIGPPDR